MTHWEFSQFHLGVDELLDFELLHTPMNQAQGWALGSDFHGAGLFWFDCMAWQGGLLIMHVCVQLQNIY